MRCCLVSASLGLLNIEGFQQFPSLNHSIQNPSNLHKKSQRHIRTVSNKVKSYSPTLGYIGLHPHRKYLDRLMPDLFICAAG